VPSAAGGILAFAPADDTVIRLDAQNRRVECRQPAEIASVLPTCFDGDLHPPGLYRLDTHIQSPHLSAARRREVRTFPPLLT
jgi:hypothetical protein